MSASAVAACAPLRRRRRRPRCARDLGHDDRDRDRGLGQPEALRRVAQLSRVPRRDAHRKLRCDGIRQGDYIPRLYYGTVRFFVSFMDNFCISFSLNHSPATLEHSRPRPELVLPRSTPYWFVRSIGRDRASVRCASLIYVCSHRGGP